MLGSVIAGIRPATVVILILLFVVADLNLYLAVVPVAIDRIARIVDGDSSLITVARDKGCLLYTSRCV